MSIIPFPLSIHSFSQEIKAVHGMNYNISWHHGFLYPHHRLISFLSEDYINGFDLIVSHKFPEYQTDSPPEMGIGYYYSGLGSQKVFGQVHGLYYYLSRTVPLFNSPFSVSQNIGMGISYNTKHFGLPDNYSNRMIGSQLNIFFLYSPGLRFRFTQNGEISFGPALIHTSNGNIKQPNFGLNLLTTRLSMKLTLDQKPLFRNRPIPGDEMDHLNRWMILFSVGYRQLSHRLPENYLTASLVGDYTRRLSPILALGAGVDFIFDPTEGREMYVTGSRADPLIPWHGGIHLSYERIWNHLSFVIQPGYKVITPSHHTFRQFNRIGVRYRLSRYVVLNCTLKSHRLVADFVELGTGIIID